MAYIFREIVRSRETSAKGKWKKKEKRGKIFPWEEDRTRSSKIPVKMNGHLLARRGRRRYIDTCPRAPPEYRVPWLNARPLWRKMKFVISHQPASTTDFAFLFIISFPVQIFHRVPVFPPPLHLGKFLLDHRLLYLTCFLPSFLPFLSLLWTEGPTTFERRRTRSPVQCRLEA